LIFGEIECGTTNPAGYLTVNESSIAAEVLEGSGLSLSQAARRFPPFRESKPVAPSTIFRWIAVGVRLPDGTRLRLEAVRLGGRWLTSGPAIERFIARQTPNLDAKPAPQPRTPRQQRRAAERAGKALTAASI
jgi:hypothetical protein